MTSKELLYVKTIAEEKNISKAAQKLFVAQPSLSQSLQRIEDALGTRLFNRTAGGLTLTYAGEKYYQMAAQILKMYDDFETEVSDINNLRPGASTWESPTTWAPSCCPGFSPPSTPSTRTWRYTSPRRIPAPWTRRF